ncbi:hypothetical protein CONCODRAFT_5502 [Conidiobolus coronatus NRRL 28638]|uniref:Uncharacterized protein n=1 Tax=Conidiobolus coronatus (strain ATCC 28846 / CBS 209.66 / NRRL 28638) TaxID=796925 RepID=A0A137P9W2_CONC2|nr:hypothetical protein CONCODRAFT_5502 [Conidiobolus coronatus NRRL 28638]|eukprot:KXN71790.1 hypothetical protein CONCODRAFT_5502 [Conidiobolus coronatus NRRL 28638]
MKFVYSKIWIAVGLLSNLHLSQSTHEHHLVPSTTADSMATPTPDSYDDYHQQNPQVPRGSRGSKPSQENQLPQTPINQSSCADSCSGVNYIPCMAECGFPDYMSLDRLIRGGGLEALMNKVFGNDTSIDTPGYTSSSKQRQIDTMSTGKNTMESATYSRNKSESHSKTIRPMKLTPTSLNPYDITTRTDLSQITVETYDLSSAATRYTSNTISTTPTGTTVSGTSLASTTTDSTLSGTPTSKTAITVTETTKATTSGQKTTTLASGSLSLYNQNTNSIRVSSTYLIFAVSILIVNL